MIHIMKFRGFTLWHQECESQTKEFNSPGGGIMLGRFRALTGVLFLTAVLLFLPAPLRADSVSVFPTPPSAGNVLLTLFALSSSPLTPLAADVRGGPALGLVSSTGGLVAIGDFGAAQPAVPNQLLLTVNFPGATESLIITLDFTALAAGGGTAFVSAFTAPLSGPITDPSLLAMLGPSVLSFTFVTSFADSQNPNVVISQWALTSIQTVPEPATGLLTATGLLAIGALCRRRAVIRSPKTSSTLGSTKI